MTIINTSWFTIKRLIGFLVMLSAILGAIITFLIELPYDDTIASIVAGLTTVVAIIAAAIKLLQEIDNQTAQSGVM